MKLILSVLVAYLFGTLTVNAVPASSRRIILVPPSHAPSRSLPSTSDPRKNSNSENNSSGSDPSGRCSYSTFVTPESRKRFNKLDSPPFTGSPSDYAWRKSTPRQIWYAVWGSQSSRSAYQKKVEKMIEMEEALVKAGKEVKDTARMKGLQKVLDCLKHPDNARVEEWGTWQYLETRPFINWENEELDRVGKIILSVPYHHLSQVDLPNFLLLAIDVYKRLKADRNAARDFLMPQWRSTAHTNMYLEHLFRDTKVQKEADGAAERWVGNIYLG